MNPEKKHTQRFFIKKIWPILVSLSGATVMLLAFFIPSIQDQWDRYQSRKVIEQYVQLGNEFFDEERYKMAEEAYTKAFDLSEGKRLDIEIRRLNARVNRVNEDPSWDSELPEEIQEVDFQLLLHLQKGKDKARERFYTLNSYGIFLALEGRTLESKQAFDEALQLDPNDVHTHINLGNLMDQEGKTGDAEKYYIKAIQLDSVNARAHYNLALIFLELKKQEKALLEFKKAARLDTTDLDAKRQVRLLQNGGED